MSVSTSGQDKPSNKGVEYGGEALETVDSAEKIFDLDSETTAVAIKAPNSNSGTVYVGFDDQVTSADGFPLRSDQSVTIDIDVVQQPIWVAPDTANDEVRFIAIG